MKPDDAPLALAPRHRSNADSPPKVGLFRFRPKALFGALLVGLCVGCASTPNSGAKVAQLTDEQLLSEAAAIDRALGTAQSRRENLLALNTDPRIVVTGASTSLNGTFSGRYNPGNNSMYGNFSGNAYTTYQSYDANTWTRAGKGLGLLVNNLQNQQLEGRRRAVLAELQRRRKAQEDATAVASRFFGAHPEIAAQTDLFIACLYAVKQDPSLSLPWLQRAAAVFRALPEDRWVGWVEAHGIPGYPQGVVVAAYAIDVQWVGDRLTGSGMGSGNQPMTLEGARLPSGEVQGTVRSPGMQATFVGKMTDTALCLEYSGTEQGNPVQGITWAYAKAHGPAGQ